MTKILVLSDTHKNLSLLEDVLQTNQDCQIIIHLGDNYEDIDNFPLLIENKQVIRVPGIFHPRYKDGSLAKTQELTLAGKRIILAHSLDDLASQRADILLVGHSHNWEISNSRNGLLVNPGHLSKESDKSRIATYGIIESRAENLSIRFFTFQHQMFLQATF
jgi:putative phosphoesterase